MCAYDIEADKTPTDNFADAGETYYTGYLAEAKELGVAEGVDDNMYALDSGVSRQDMFTLLYRAFIVLGELPETEETVDLSA